MKKIVTLLLVLSMLFALSGCALFEMFEDEETVVDLGNGEESVKWHLVSNNNAYHAVESAYFEFDAEGFRYYEDGALKKEGAHRITYFGVENTISPLHINLDFGQDENGFSVFDYLDCYTEDTKENLHQFTIMNEGYHIEPLGTGGVPVRDYHLSEMPYAFGTYVKEGAEQYTYENGKANYLNCAKLDGSFVDDAGNKFYFANNSYSSDPQSVHYRVYMRYENHVNNTFVEGTVRMSWYEDWDTDERHDVAMIYVMHGDSEPTEEAGVSVSADYQLLDFVFGDDGSLSFVSASYFYDNQECDYDPANFIAGTYRKVATPQ